MVTICTLKSWAEFGEGGFGFLAAAFWFYASWQGRVSFFDTPMNQFDTGLRSQSRNNAIAAFCAGIVALLQIFVFYAPLCKDFG